MRPQSRSRSTATRTALTSSTWPAARTSPTVSQRLPAAAHEGGPLLLTSRGELNDVVMEEVERLSPDRIVIVGGEPSVSPAVADALEPLADEVVRLAGADRYETSRLIAAYAFDASGSAFMATGRSVPRRADGGLCGRLDRRTGHPGRRQGRRSGRRDGG